MIERPNHVRVVNGTDLKIEGRYDGVDYEFLPKEKVDIPQAVAAHIFGFGEKDKTKALTRLGWLHTSDQMKAAMSNLSKIKFTQAPALIASGDDEEEEDDEAAERVPASKDSRPVSPDVSGRGGAPRAAASPSNPR